MSINHSFFYLLIEDGEILEKTNAASVDSAIDYFTNLGYDFYKNPELIVKPVKEDYKEKIEEMREKAGDSWDSWHPHY